MTTQAFGFHKVEVIAIRNILNIRNLSFAVYTKEIG